MNAVLHHCALPAMRVASGSTPRAALFPEEADENDEQHGDEDGDDEAPALLAPRSAGGAGPVLRPGIVHRLDKGCVYTRAYATSAPYRLTLPAVGG